MKYTNHLNLKKPENDDYFDQENHANYNMNVIDDAISGHLADKENPHNVTASQIGAVPISRTVNGKALSSNVSITASDVGAAAGGHTHSATDINAGTLNVARIPTGTTSSTVALGNHTHAYAPLTGGGTSGTWPINISGSAAQVGGYTVAQLMAASGSNKKYQPTVIDRSESSLTSTEKNIVNISGSGFLSGAWLLDGNGVYMTIYIDDVLYFTTRYYTSNAGAVGIGTHNQIQAYSYAFQTDYRADRGYAPTVQTYLGIFANGRIYDFPANTEWSANFPSTDNGRKSILIDKPLEFNTRLRITLYTTDRTSGQIKIVCGKYV